MPKKNLLAFIVLTALLIAGWWWVRQNWLAQPPPAKDSARGEGGGEAEGKSKDKNMPKEELPAGVWARTVGVICSPGDGPVLAASALFPGRSKYQVPPPKSEAKEVAKAKEDKGKDAAKVEAAPSKVPAEKAVDIFLGDPKNPEYFILATITTKGGGIRNLTLPKFQKANWNGQPVWNPDGTPTPLQLVEDDPIVSSFLMANYPDPKKTDMPGDATTALGQKIWKCIEAMPGKVVLETDVVPDLRITKTYTLKPQQYHIELAIEIQDTREPQADQTKNKARQFRYQLAGSHGMPIEGEWYTSIYRSPMIGLLDKRGYLWRDLDETQRTISVQEGGKEVVPTDGKMIQFAGVATQYFASLIVVDNDQSTPAKGGVEPWQVLAYCRPTLESEEMEGFLDRVDDLDPNRPMLLLQIKATKDKPARTERLVLLPRTKLQIEHRGLQRGDHVFVNFYDPEDGGYKVATLIRAGGVPRPQLDDISVRVVSNILELKPGEKKVHKFLLYHGPTKVWLLSQFRGEKAVDPELVTRYCDTLHLQAMTDYRSAGFFGAIASKIMWTDVLIRTTIWMHWLLNVLHLLVQNYGLSIILLTVLVRGAMFPISRRSALLSQKMQALGPEIKKVQEKYKNDPQAKTAEVMALYRKHGVNPFGSCLPMLLQLPFFLGLYYCLQESIHFRLASFLWVDNLAAPDMLIGWGSGIPIISDPDNMSGSFFSFLYLGPYFNLLPVIAVTLMLLQQKMMTPPPADEQQEMQQKMMKYMFIFIGIMFYKVAAGLCIYFIVSSLWGLCERKMLPKRAPVVALAAASAGGGGSGAPAGGGNKQIRGKAKPEKKEKKPEGAMQKVKDWWAEVRKQAEKK